MTDDDTPVGNLQTQEEIDWLKQSRSYTVDSKQAQEFIYAATKELVQSGGDPFVNVGAAKVEDAYQKFTDAVNMTASEIRDWDEPEVNHANRVVSFITEMCGVEQGDSTEDCPSDWDIALLNWGYRPDDVDL
jgi:hypothetical protein